MGLAILLWAMTGLCVFRKGDVLAPDAGMGPREPDETAVGSALV